MLYLNQKIEQFRQIEPSKSSFKAILFANTELRKNEI